jgi:penicillin-binding protein 1A
MFRMHPRINLRIVLLGLAGCCIVGISTLLGAYLYVANSLPRVDTLSDYRPPVITRVFGDDGTVIAEFYRERRIVVPVQRLPKQLIQAFVAAEDGNFYQHQGVDFVSILRATVKNLAAGGIVQGGSTITQQVAKSLLLTPEKKFSRKFKEAILAWRMEQKLSKDEILYLYLNQIFLGHGAYGVQAASENYFDKNVEELSLAEVAILAGLPQAPSRYSPYQHLARAKDRQKYVLARMVHEGYITEAAAEAAYAEELTIHPRVNRHVAGAAYFAEQVRRHLEQTYGEEGLYTGGLQVRSTMNVAMQEAAERAVRENLREHDKRQGYRGPQKVLAEQEELAFLAEQAAALDKRPPQDGDLLKVVLSGGSDKALQVRYGRSSGEISLKSAGWAGPLRVVGRDKTPGATRLPIGSLLEVRVEKRRTDGSPELALEQEPLAEGALVALEPGSGHVKAMVGGYDFSRSQFNRALQARRLPGSAFKPLIYAAALDKGYTPASVILDTPVIYKERLESGEETEWKPKNYTEKFYGPVSVRSALTHSLNVITIKMLEDIGVGYAAGYARMLGVSSPMARDLTMALGSSALTPIELATAYTVFASGGVRVSPTYITRVTDRDGHILESVDPVDFPQGPRPGQRLIPQAAERVISAETAYLVTNLMESVVRDGTGARAKTLGRPVAGKTGTTNDLKDAWFAGFVPQLVAVSWIGYDQERPLGKGETGSRAALPAWLSFMQEAVKEMVPLDFPVPDSIEFRPIDPETGLLAPEDSAQAYIEAFAPGTAPIRYALDAKRPRARDFFRLDREDSD